MNKILKLNPTELQVAHRSEILILKKRLEQMEQLIATLTSSTQRTVLPSKNKLSIKLVGVRKLVAFEDIVYCQAMGNYTRVFVRNQDHSKQEKKDETTQRYDQLSSYVMSKSLKQVMDMIQDDNFVRCHQSYLINSEFVLDKSSDGVKLFNDINIPVSRRRRRMVQERLMKGKQSS